MMSNTPLYIVPECLNKSRWHSLLLSVYLQQQDQPVCMYMHK